MVQGLSPSSYILERIEKVAEVTWVDEYMCLVCSDVYTVNDQHVKKGDTVVKARMYDICPVCQVG